MRQLQRDQRADRFRHHHAQRNRHRKFEIAVKRKQNQKISNIASGPMTYELLLGFEKFAVFSAPLQPISGRQRLLIPCHGALPVVHGAFQVAALDAELNADVARIVFAIDKRCAARFLNSRQARKAEFAALRACPPAGCQSAGRFSGTAAPCAPPDRIAFRPESLASPLVRRPPPAPRLPRRQH